MQQRKLGRTGLSVGVFGFGCGAVGGLMTRGPAAEQERAVARALELGVTYFDTAASYGDGESERNLGRILKLLKPDVVVGTKVRIPDEARGRIGAAITEALDASLARLGRDSVDLFQLHNLITISGAAPTLTTAQVLEEVVPAFERLRAQGKLRFIGITGIGDARSLREVVESGAIDTAQVPYNLLNPSPMRAVPAGYPAHDFGGLMQHCAAADVGVIGIRVLAGGALSGETTRHPVAMAEVEPIGTARSYAMDVARACLLMPLVQEGHAGSLVEAAIRFAISAAPMSNVLVGIASLEQFEIAAEAALKGPLSEAALARVAALQDGFAP
jgi:aryl-alcohol dehydrogenase-like predicted oxidoreductase